MGDEDRRVKIFQIDTQAVLDWFVRAADGYPGFIHVPKVDLPAGARVLQVREDFASRCFQFLVQHESFPVVPPGEIPPMGIQGLVNWYLVRLEKGPPLPDSDVPVFVVPNG